MNAYARPRTGTRRDPVCDRRIADHLDMARRIALRVARRIPPWLSEEDLVGAAMIGLTEAAERYDETRGEPFVAFAEKRIRGAVLDELRRGDMLPRRVRNTARKVGATIRELEQRYGRPPEDAEIAAALGVPLAEYLEDLEALPHVGFVELGEERKLGAAGVSLDPCPESAAERSELVRRVKECTERLCERDALILSLYYVEELNYGEIGEVLDVSESRVCQLHARAIARLRAEMDAAPGAKRAA